MADTVYLVRDGYLYKHRENDGASYLKHGPQEQVTCLGTVEEAKTKYPNELMRATGVNDHAVRQ
jgi:hypothetical protein